MAPENRVLVPGPSLGRRFRGRGRGRGHIQKSLRTRRWLSHLLFRVECGQAESETPKNSARSRLSSFCPGNWTSSPPPQEVAERATCENPRGPPALPRCGPKTPAEPYAMAGWWWAGGSAQAGAVGFALTFPSSPLAPKRLPCSHVHPRQFRPGGSGPCVSGSQRSGVLTHRRSVCPARPADRT